MKNFSLLLGLCLPVISLSGCSDSSSSSGFSSSVETKPCSLCRGTGRTLKGACTTCAGRGYTEVPKWVKDRQTLADENQRRIASGEKPMSPDEARREQDKVSREQWWDRNRFWVILIVVIVIGAIVMEQKGSKGNKTTKPLS